MSCVQLLCQWCVDPTASSSKKINFGFYSLCFSASLLKHIRCNCSAESTGTLPEKMIQDVSHASLAWLSENKIMGEIGFRLAEQRKSETVAFPSFSKHAVLWYSTGHIILAHAMLSQTKYYVYFYTFSLWCKASSTDAEPKVFKLMNDLMTTHREPHI